MSLHRPDDFLGGCGQVCSGEQAEVGAQGRWTFLPFSEHEGSSPLTRGNASLVNNPSNDGEGVEQNCVFSSYYKHLPNELKTRHIRRKLKKKQGLDGPEAWHCLHRLSAESSVSFPMGCVIPSYRPRTREEILLFEHNSPWFV